MGESSLPHSPRVKRSSQGKYVLGWIYEAMKTNSSSALLVGLDYRINNISSIGLL